MRPQRLEVDTASLESYRLWRGAGAKVSALVSPCGGCLKRLLANSAFPEASEADPTRMSSSGACIKNAPILAEKLGTKRHCPRSASPLGQSCLARRLLPRRSRIQVPLWVSSWCQATCFSPCRYQCPRLSPMLACSSRPYMAHCRH